MINVSEREKAIQILKELPDTISLKEILETLSMMLEINTRIDAGDENDVTTNDDLQKEIEKW